MMDYPLFRSTDKCAKGALSELPAHGEDFSEQHCLFLEFSRRETFEPLMFEGSL